MILMMQSYCYLCREGLQSLSLEVDILLQGIFDAIKQ